MIKHINHQNFSTTPFVATKSWELFNIENDSVIMLEPFENGVQIPDTNLALDYIDYTIGTNPIINTECSIALEQQEEDQIIFEEGISSSLKTFDPISQPKNTTGTYKSLLYRQIANAFYNTYKNPTQIFGMENIDFPSDKTERWIAENFRMFTIPQKMFGEKLVEGSVRFYDTSFDDNVDIYDDKSGNLIAANNLFSKIQELGSFENDIVDGTAVYECSLP